MAEQINVYAMQGLYDSHNKLSDSVNDAISEINKQYKRLSIPLEISLKGDIHEYFETLDEELIRSISENILPDNKDRNRSDLIKKIISPVGNHEYDFIDLLSSWFIEKVGDKYVQCTYDEFKSINSGLILEPSYSKFSIERSDIDKDKFFSGDFSLIKDLNLFERAGLYINSIPDEEMRKYRFLSYKKRLEEDLLCSSFDSNLMVRIAPDENYPDLGYPFLDLFSEALRMKLSNSNNKNNNLILTDKPTVLTVGSINQIYLLLRYRHGTQNWAYVYNDKPVEWNHFALIHEFAHQKAGVLDTDFMDHVGNTDLMLAPVFYEDVDTKHIAGKITDESVKEAYKSLIA